MQRSIRGYWTYASKHRNLKTVIFLLFLLSRISTKVGETKLLLKLILFLVAVNWIYLKTIPGSTKSALISETMYIGFSLCKNKMKVKKKPNIWLNKNQSRQRKENTFKCYFIIEFRIETLIFYVHKEMISKVSGLIFQCKIYTNVW